MRPLKVVLLVLGALAAVTGLALFLGGGALVVVHSTQRDDGGYYTTSVERLETPTYALTSEHIDLGADLQGDDWGPFDDVGTARIVADSTNGRPVFVGIAPTSDIEGLLSRSAHDELTDVNFDPFRPEFRRQAGETPPALPADQPFWVASASGPGRQTVTWDIEPGEWDVVVMNADASPGVSVDAAAGIKTGLLLPIGLGLLAAGLLVGAIATALMVGALAGGGPGSATAAAGDSPATAGGAASAPAPGSVPAGSYPLRIDGRLDEPLSRWLWLVKWLLAIPHLIVLGFLWIAFAVLTVVAGFSILFTGRYPRSIFDFNVGVLRWTWRVTFYAFALGTDRYPPFSLQADAGYPADVTVDYPQELSRPLVLVKWWLLAIPQYLIIGIFGGGLTWLTGLWGSQGGEGAVIGGGLIGLLVLIAGVVLLFTGRYPRPLFDFVMGMERWTYRVWAYAALMRDEYPPFRLDNGGTDPGSTPVPPPAPAPSGDGSLVTTERSKR